MSTVTRYRHTFLSAAKTALQIKIAHPTPLSFASFGTSGLNYFFRHLTNSISHADTRFRTQSLNGPLSTVSDAD